MALEDIAADHYQAQQRIIRNAAEEAQSLWGELFAMSAIQQWMALLANVVELLVSAQLSVARLAMPFLQAAAREQGVRRPSRFIVPEAFAGVAADGRELPGLLMQPALRTAALLVRGADDRDALRSGLASLLQIMDTEIADASRAATQVGLVANRGWVMYMRQVNLPACGRCIVLAGRTYSWSAGFARHPRCDCTVVPVRAGDDLPASPAELFEQMTPEQQAKAFTVGGAEAIRLGADIGQVVNARRGMQTVGGRLITTEGTTVRGVAGKKLGNFKRQKGDRYRRSQVPRPMPEQILADTEDDRDEAIRLLKKFGYIT